MLYDALTRRADFLPNAAWDLIYLAWVIASTVFLLMHRRRPTTTLAWLLAFWTLPLVAAIGYFLFGPRSLDDQRNLRQAAKRHARGSSPAPEEVLPPEFVAESPFSELARVTRNIGDPSVEPSRADALELFADGDEAYPAIRRAIAEAQETVHLEYYIWQPDIIGTMLRDQLAERARDGIGVRLVLDSLGAKNCRDAFWQPVIDAGGAVRKFNPPRLLKPQPGKLNFRTHRKIVVCDGRVGFVGGINVSDDNRTTDDGERSPPWRSTHLRIDGEPVRELQRIFLEDWLYALPLSDVAAGIRDAKYLLEDQPAPEMPEDIERWFPEPPAEDDEPDADADRTRPWVQIVDSGPDEPTDDIQRLYFAAITAARHRLWITTPYLVPDEPIETAIANAAARGVDVQIVIPENSDSRMVEAAAETYSAALSEEGVKVHLYRPKMNHSKTLVVDDAFAIVGTANMDNRSFRLNFEVVAAVFDEDFNARLAERFEADRADSRPFDPESDDSGFMHRLYVSAMRLLSPLL